MKNCTKYRVGELYVYVHLQLINNVLIYNLVRLQHVNTRKDKQIIMVTFSSYTPVN
jgi:hypothetical protein